MTENIRNIKIKLDPLADEWEIIETNAPDEIIIDQLKINAGKIDDGQDINDPYSFITDNGFFAYVVLTSDDDGWDIIYDAEFCVSDSQL